MVSGIILGGLLVHVDKENLGFGRISVKTHSDDNRGIPGRGLFFEEQHPPGFLGPIYGISGFFANEKDAESRLEQGPPSFSP